MYILYTNGSQSICNLEHYGLLIHLKKYMGCIKADQNKIKVCVTKFYVHYIHTVFEISQICD